MKPNILCKTKGSNNYLYNFNMNRFMLIHPIFNYILDLAKKGDDLEARLDDLQGDGITIDGRGPFSKEEILYYYRKYLLFSENQLFGEVKPEEIFDGRVTEEQVYMILANVNSLVFEATDGCNLKCVYCGYGEYYENYDTREKKNLSFAKAKNLLNYLAKYWRSPLNTSPKNRINVGFYGGEPLLNIGLIKEVVAYCRQMETPRHRFIFRMTTNALLLEKYADFLAENDFGILISLDGNKQHNGYRVFPGGGEAYHAIFRNVEALKNKYPDYFNKNVNFNVVLHNKNSISEIYEYFKRNFDKIPTISELNPYGIKHDKQEDFLQMYRNALEDLNLAKDHLKLEKEMFTGLPNIEGLCSIINNCSGHCFTDYSELLYGTKDQKRIPTGTCLPFSKKIFLSVNGKIMPCERIGQQFYFGTVDEENVYLDAQKVARAANSYFDKIRDKCFNCFKANLCSTCVYNLDIDGSQDDVDCPQFMGREKFSTFLSSWLSKLEESPGYYPRIMDEVYIK